MTILYKFVGLDGSQVVGNMTKSNLYSSSNETVRLFVVCSSDNTPQFMQVLEHFSLSSVNLFFVSFLSDCFYFVLSVYCIQFIFSDSSGHKCSSKAEWNFGVISCNMQSMWTSNSWSQGCQCRHVCTKMCFNKLWCWTRFKFR